MPSVSVVVSTLNRSESLRATLIALRYQRHEDFEVVVVEGPSVVSAEGLVEEFGNSFRYERCADSNLSRSRNIGIAAAAGELIAFIDDDAVPDPRWLGDLVAAYDGPLVAGAGGVTYDHTGTRMQYRFSRCDRLGQTIFGHVPVRDDEQAPGIEVFPYLQGTNMSFTRESLVSIGGFDEEIEYNFDEVEVCLRLVDSGKIVRSLDGAIVYHKYLPSHVRNADRLFTDPYLPVKNRAYFALSNGRPARSTEQVLQSLGRYLDDVRASARATRDEGKFTEAQLEFFLTRLEAGYDVGLRAGLGGTRRGVAIPEAQPAEYRPYSRLQPSDRRLTACFLSQEYPPGEFGGVGRYTSELATGIAALGHEVHVFTRAGDGIGTLDFEGGCWIHRVAAIDKHVPELEHSAVAGNLYLVAANYHEVLALGRRQKIDFVSAPLWLCEGVCCALDPTVATSTTLVTSMRTIAGMHPSWAMDAHPQAMIRLESETLAHSDHLHAISEAILEQSRADQPAAADVPGFVEPLGVEDRFVPGRAKPRDGEDCTVLFVGRLEVRKGVDVLLDAARRLMPERPGLRVVIAGRDTANTERGETFREQFLREAEPDIRDRVTFLGPVDEEELWRLYEECDIFCAPSRYESFGLVLVEAMMFGKPVVGCATGGMPEIIDARVGSLAKPGDAGSLADCLGQLIDDRDLRERCGRAARERYLERFELAGVIKRTLEAYTEHVVGSETAQTSNEADRQAVARAVETGFARVIQRTTNIAADSAERAARRLLEPDAYPIDYVREIERAQMLGQQDYLVSLFRTLLRRDPHDGDLQIWGQADDSPGWRHHVLVAIATSPEAESLDETAKTLILGRGAEVEPPVPAEIASKVNELIATDDDAFLEGLYPAVLGRVIDPAGKAAWSGALGQGQTRAEIISALAASDEARRRGVRAARLMGDLGEDPANLLRRAWPRDDREFVRRVYEIVLEREPDEPGLLGHVARLRAGLGRLHLVSDFARSPECKTAGQPGWLEDIMRDPPPDRPREVWDNPVTDRVRQALRRGRGYGLRAGGAPRQLYSTARGLKAMPSLVEGIVGEQGSLNAHQGEMARDVEALRDDLRRLSSRSVASSRIEPSTFDTRLEELSDGVRSLAQMVDVLRRKQEAVSLDLRERAQTAGDGAASEPITPVIPDEDRLRRRIEEIGGIRLNLGCGEKPLPGYINVDFRRLPDVDVVADIRRLPFEPGTVDEITSSHLVEHFRQHQLQVVILPYWRRMLADDGILRIVCPNWEAMVERVSQGKLGFRDFKTVTFGLQDYEGDDHFAMYSPETLAAVLGEAGFGDVQAITTTRVNGMSIEMEITARRG